MWCWSVLSPCASWGEGEQAWKTASFDCHRQDNHGKTALVAGEGNIEDPLVKKTDKDKTMETEDTGADCYKDPLADK